MRLWTARVFGTLGSQILMLAVGWQMYDLTGSAWDLGLVGLLQFLPALLLSLVAGHVADRVHRGRIVATCVALQALVAVTLLWVTHEQWVSREWLLMVSLVLGAARAFQMPAQQALTPLLVPPALLPQAMAMSAAGMQAATIGGPALGGAIFLAGASAVYGTGVLLFGVSVVLLIGLRYEHVPPPREPMTIRSVLAGVHFIWEKKPFWVLCRWTCLPYCWAGPRPCCRCLPKTFCTPGPGVWACCAPLRRWVRCWCPSCWRAGRCSAKWAVPCCCR